MPFNTRATRTNQIIELLRSHRNQWVPLPAILKLQISQYSARIHEARHKLGLNIENRTEVVDGKKYSWFRLVEPLPTAPLTPSYFQSRPANPDLFSAEELERTAKWEDLG